MADDELRSDLANATDQTKGATLVSYNGYQTVREHLSDVVTFEQFGAGSSTTDNAPLERLITYLNSRSSGCVVRFDGYYRFTQPCPVILTRDNVMLCGRGTLDCSGMPMTDGTFLLWAEGPGFTGAATTLTENWDDSTTYNPDGSGIAITVASTTGFNAGDHVTITSDEYWGGSAGQGFRSVGRGRLRRVLKIIDSTHIALDESSNYDVFDAISYTVNVRALRMLEALSICDLTIIGPKENIEFEPDSIAGPGFLFGRYLHGYRESGLNISAFQTSGTELRFADSVILQNNVYRSVWAGNRIFSVRHAAYINGDFAFGRRMQDWDCSYRPWGTDNREEVQTEHIQILGGISRNANTAFGGHMAHGVTAIGCIARNTRTGLHNRGKNTRLVGCDFQVQEVGVVLGLGSSGLEDVGTWKYPINAGYCIIDATTRLIAGSRGVHATTSWDRFQCDAYIESRNALSAFGQYLSNVKITANFKGTDPTATYGGYCFGLGNTPPIEASNILIQGGTIEGTNRAIWHLGVQPGGTISNVRVDGVTFKDVNTYYVRGEGTLFDDSCCVTNCVHVGEETATKVSGLHSDPQRAVFWESNNTWSPSVTRGNLDGQLVVYIKGEMGMINLNPTTNANITSLSSGRRSQTIVLRNDGPGTLTVANNPPTIRLNGAYNNAAPGSTLTLISVSSTGSQWAELSRMIVT